MSYFKPVNVKDPIKNNEFAFSAVRNNRITAESMDSWYYLHLILKAKVWTN